MSQAADDLKGRERALPPWTTDREVARQAEEFMATLDPKRYVGSKHHIVPRFILRRFANRKDQVLVRNRATGAKRISNTGDLAVTDFYTFIDTAGELNASYEQIWGHIESATDSILRQHLDNQFARPRPFNPVEKHVIDSFVALQSIRGPAKRRVMELVADYGIKLVNQDKLSVDDLDNLEFRPHQNHHLEALARVLPQIEEQFASRAAFLVTLDEPLLVISDEPVCLERPDDYVRPTRKQMRDYPRDVLVDGRPVSREDVIQFAGGGVGFANAEEIVMPVGPRHAIAYDRPGSLGPVAHLRLDGLDAEHFANEVSGIVIEQAVDWIAGHLDHPTLGRMRLPNQPPPLVIFDGGTRLSQNVHRTDRRKPVRLDKTSRPETPEPT
ncbi:DUF4238 domain-containing protein [Nocardioides montaniterrae]